MERNILKYIIKYILIIYNRMQLRVASQIPFEKGKFYLTVKTSVLNAKCFYYMQLWSLN
jgi:hypothetical protein